MLYFALRFGKIRSKTQLDPQIGYISLSTVGEFMSYELKFLGSTKFISMLKMNMLITTLGE